MAVHTISPATKVLAAVVCALIGACSSGNDESDPCAGGSTAPECATADAGATDGAATPERDAATSADEGAASEDPTKPPAAYSGSCTESSECDAGLVCVAELCIIEPTGDAALTSAVDDRPAGAPVDLSCVDAATPTPEGPETVRVYGLVDRFGGGKQTIGVEVAVFLASDFHPEGCTQDDAGERRTCILDESGTPIGTFVSVDPDDWAPNAELLAAVDGMECSDHFDCPRGYECDDPKGFDECVKQYGIYWIDGVPTNTPLVFRTRPTRRTLSMREGYLHDVVLRADRAAPGPMEGVDAMRFDPTVVSESQWVQVPNTFGSSIRIRDGHTAVGGRIRDCAPDDREPSVSFYISGANVGSGKLATKIGYFNDNEDNALPQPSQTSTNILGRYAIIDVEGGWNRVAAAARVDGELKSLGAQELWLVPDALNILSFPGRLSYQRK